RHRKEENMIRLNNSTGTVYVAVYDESNFGNSQLAKVRLKAPAAKGDITFVVQDLPAGRYAVFSYRDENGNGTLDANSLGARLPKAWDSLTTTSPSADRRNSITPHSISIARLTSRSRSR